MFEYCKLTIASLFVLLLNVMPASVRPTLDFMFGGVRKYQEKAVSERQAAYQT